MSSVLVRLERLWLFGLEALGFEIGKLYAFWSRTKVHSLHKPSWYTDLP
jgi:hypothetical protein